MGLDCTHGAFNGAYSSFSCLCEYVEARAVALDSVPYLGGAVRLVDGRDLFLGHSDCDGEFSPSECELVAEFLEWVVVDGDSARVTGNPGTSDDDAIRKFAGGCRRAAAAGEELLFR